MKRDYGELLAKLEIAKRENDACQARFNSIIDRNADGMIIVNVDGIVQFANPAAEDVFSLPRTQLVGRTFGFPAAAGAVVEIEIIQGNGSIVVTEMRVAETTWQGDKAFLVSLRDMTERKRIDRFREDYIHAISHDLRGPLAVIQGNAQLLERALGKNGSNGVERQSVTAIINSVRSMNTMIEELVESARIDSGQLHAELAPTDLYALLIELKERTIVAHSDRQIDVICADRLPRVLADVKFLERILWNLLHNAVRYSDPGDHIKVTLSEKDDYVLCTVFNSGVGIATAELPHVFEKYYRASSSHNEQEGLGLGLYITRALVEAQGGHIWVESKKDEWTIFNLTLPIVPW